MFLKDMYFFQNTSAITIIERGPRVYLAKGPLGVIALPRGLVTLSLGRRPRGISGVGARSEGTGLDMCMLIRCWFKCRGCG